MRKNIYALIPFKLLVVLVLTSCSSKSTKSINKKNIQNQELSDIPTDFSDESDSLDDEKLDDENSTDVSNPSSSDFWAKNYYHSTQLILKNASIKDNEQDIWFICQGKTLSETPGYQKRIQDSIKYLAKPLTFTTKGGFIKKVYVTKGMCRELGLYQNLITNGDKPDKHQRFRKILKEVVIEYVYTKKAYATKLVFGTTFDDVIFEVY